MIAPLLVSLRYETRLVAAPRPSSATKPPSSGLLRPSALTTRAPTFAHGPRGRQASTPWPTGTPGCHVGQRRASGTATGGLGVGTTSPGHCDRARRAVAKIGTVCLRAKKTRIGLGAIVGGGFGRFYARRCPAATGAERGRRGPVVAQRKAVAGRGNRRPPQREHPAWHNVTKSIARGSAKSSKGGKREG